MMKQRMANAARHGREIRDEIEGERERVRKRVGGREDPRGKRGKKRETRIITRSVFSFAFYSRRLGEISVTLLCDAKARLLFK